MASITRCSVRTFLFATALMGTGPAFAADLAGPWVDCYAVVVKQSTVDEPQWQRVVAALKEKHKATVVTYDVSADESLAALKELFPRYTCFVAKPEEAGRSVRRPGSPADSPAG